jgi:20S proteasome subunit alpha 2
MLTRSNVLFANLSSLSCFLAKDGVVIASEKKLHPLVLGDTVHKIANVTDNIGMVYSGIGPDFRVLVRKARKKAQAYFRYYKEQISVNRLVREVAAIMQEYTQSGYVTLKFSTKCFVFSRS